ncbi:DNA-formamidopyrimidine glycosylase family protein [Nocardioides sp. W7]|uniref:DNA-formamidopyrimidine glycosylase family protein n=1 Tax=Nocardioides sp. W7 TaxID=2931390 RepID=UPI001FCFFA24|nr:DNA-formamidopyrimidine glycosylase family protein [Nocardioides sp. W7]
MPELPEVETARAAIERSALGRIVADVDDSDSFVCRPHAPGEIRSALVGHRLVAARRRGKSMWCETDGGPLLGLHLGMAGRIVVTPPAGTDAEPDAGGDYWGDGPTRPGATAWYRFTLHFEDGGALRLHDKRRLGRVRLDPDLDALGPDAEEIDRAEFRRRVGRGRAPLKARLLDQSALAGVGNLLADETLWRSALDPRRTVDTLTTEDLDLLRRELRAAIRSAVRYGGVHTGEIIEHRRPGGRCPRCGAEMVRGTVGGRTTWWCATEQR